jgi:hypothetical protein
MPRVRLTAGRWLALAVISAGIAVAPGSVTPVVAAPPGAAPRSVAPAAARPGRTADTDARRRDELDLLQRQDAAEALKKHFNIEVDWRTTPLDRLLDIRVRAAKAAELQQRLGVSIDWQHYSWIELEALRRTLISFETYRDQQGGPPRAAARVDSAPGRDDGVLPPTFKGAPPAAPARSTDPDGVLPPTFRGRAGRPTLAADPDGVIRPTFAVPPRWSAFGRDPDGLIAPTFVPYRRVSSLGDTDDLMDPTRTPERRTVPARW